MWAEPIGRYVGGKQTVTIMDIAKEALFIDTGKVGCADQNRIKRVLTRFGWNRGAKQRFGVPWHAPKVTR